MATQRELAQQMIRQLRVLDPSVSAEIGTPERKIIDTVAQAIAENQIDLSILAGSFDLDAKFGSDLDKFLSIFGFGRQTGRTASGYIRFSRPTASVYDIPIPSGTQVTTGVGSTTLRFATTESATLAAGELSVVVPIRALLVGEIGNVAANTITQFGNTPILGITDVTNEVPTTGGLDPESDDELKVRFKNTVFRNLAGTHDQFLALAVSTQYTTKANVVGPISRYREYIQVPDADDASPDPTTGTSGNGAAGEWTTALSTIPYSKYVYEDIPYFVSNGNTGANALFFRQDVDFKLNVTDASRDRGDTYRGRIDGGGKNVFTDTTTDYQPNITFLNVYTGSADAAQAIRAGDILLFEHSYMSSASRNDYSRGILNCVDLFINGENPTLADVVIPRPSGTAMMFNAVNGDRFYVENYRRVGEPNHRPVLGNTFTPLYWQPVIDLPETITTSDATYLKGVHYWPVEDVSDIGGTVRARSGIEWSTGTNGKAQGDPELGPYTGPKITATVDSSLNITSYVYDRNIVDLQIACEGSKQVTSDVLAHRAVHRYFKLDVTVMYATGTQTSLVDEAIRQDVEDFLGGQYFGTTIQLSDLLQVIHNVGGVDNVRWSRDLNGALNCVTEVDVNGSPLLTVLADRRTAGTTSAQEIQQLYVAGNPTGGTYKLNYKSGNATNTSAAIAYNASASTVQTELRSITGDTSLTVSGSGTATNPFVATFSAAGTRSLITCTPSLTGGNNVFNEDFFLKDDELPALATGLASGDTVAGLKIRPRAQNTWNQP